MLKNPEKKARRGYKDKRTYVRMDGSEVLYGKDWTQRKKELWERASGRCERIVAIDPAGPVRCKSEGHDPHHVEKRWPKRTDELKNLELLCRLHHELLDSRKPRWTPRSQAEKVEA